MIKTFCFLLLSATLALGVSPTDTFDLSITSVGVKGTTFEVAFTIVNKSVGPVSVDLGAEAVIVKSAHEKADVQTQIITTRPGIYKPRLTILVPGDQQIFFTPKSSRAFAPKILAPGESLSLTKDIPISAAAFLKDIQTQPYTIFLSLAYQTDTDKSCQGTAPSPTYKITGTADGKLAVTAG